MAGKRELGFPRSSTCNLKEQLVRTTLRNVRAQGHPYVELREDGKKLIFFCTLCLAPCYSDSILFNHLKGHLHTQRLATAKATLLKPNPWPFSDGVFFFCDDLVEQNQSLSVSDPDRINLLQTHQMDDENSGQNQIVSYRVPSDSEVRTDCDEIPSDQNLNSDRTSHELVIPSVLQKDEVSDLVVRHMGIGRIGARLSKKEGGMDEICRIWCEWLGSKEFSDEDIDEVPEHDFAIVTFPYNYSLGRMGLLDNLKYLLPSSPRSEVEDSCDSTQKKRKLFSNIDDTMNQSNASEEESQSSNSNSQIVLSNTNSQLASSRVFSSKTMRKEVREQQRIAAERSCDLCQQKMLPEKDVAALLNRKTGKIACSSRNLTGAFHVFHISCLIHWILLCEVEIHANPSVSIAPKAKRRSKRKVKGKNFDEKQETRKQIYSAFCPECQGTGIEIEKEKLEKPTVPLAEIFRFKIKLCDAHKSWMKSPESLPNCSMGFHFPLHSDEIEIDQETVASLKLLHFYRADV